MGRLQRDREAIVVAAGAPRESGRPAEVVLVRRWPLSAESRHPMSVWLRTLAPPKTLFHLFPYQSVDAHLAVSMKMKRRRRVDEPLSVPLDGPNLCGPCPNLIPRYINVMFNF